MASKKSENRTVAVIDTNVFIGAADAVFSKVTNRVITIPMVVLNELEKHRNDVSSGWACRTVLNYVETLRKQYGGEALSSINGVELNNHSNNSVRVETDHLNTDVLGDLNDGSNDSKILAVAANLKSELKTNVELISNDLPLRLKANIGLGLTAYEYGCGNVKPYTGVYELKVFKPFDEIDDDEILEMLKEANKDNGGVIPYHAFIKLVREINSGEVEEYYCVKNNNSIEPLDPNITLGNAFRPKNIEQEMAMTYLSDRNIQVVSLGGVAGAGKSFLALAEGFREVKAKKVDKIIVFRSMYELGQQKVGFLPGDLDDKIEPWAQAVWDNISKIDRMTSSKKKQQQGGNGADGGALGFSIESSKKKHEFDVEISPISFLRGRTLDDAFIIVDDAQSLDRVTLLDILARLGKNTRIVFTFDINQNDNPYISESTSILQLINDLRGNRMFAHIDFTISERSSLAQLASRLLEMK